MVSDIREEGTLGTRGALTLGPWGAMTFGTWAPMTFRTWASVTLGIWGAITLEVLAIIIRPTLARVFAQDRNLGRVPTEERELRCVLQMGRALELIPMGTGEQMLADRTPQEVLQTGPPKEDLSRPLQQMAPLPPKGTSGGPA